MNVFTVKVILDKNARFPITPHSSYVLADSNKIMRIVATFRNLIGLSFQRLAIIPNLIITVLLVQFCCSAVLKRQPWQSASIDETEYFMMQWLLHTGPVSQRLPFAY